ncbi:hypothetical protein B0H11DRAFT_4643 [Mycena galericulata]|nr:hypothetical protein B0H11DRAFT_4643 [Mycena galericulata]
MHVLRFQFWYAAALIRRGGRTLQPPIRHRDGFDPQTHPHLQSIWTSRTIAINIMEATIQIQQVIESDPKIGLFTNCAGFVAVVLLYTHWCIERPVSFKPFSAARWCRMHPTNSTPLSLVRTMGHAQESK